MKNSFYLFLFTLCLVSPSFVFDTAALGNPGQELLKETDSNGRIIGLDNINDPSAAVGSTCVPQVNVRGLISDIEISEDNSVISGISFRTDEPGQRTHAHYNLSDKVRNSQEIRSFLTNGEPVSISYISTGASCRFLWVTSIRSIASTDRNRADAEPIIPFDPGIHQLYYYTSRGSSGLYSNDFISVGYYRQGDQVIGALSYNSPDSFCFAGVLNSNVINIEISNEPIENIPASIDLSQMIRPPGQSDSQYTGFIEYCSNEYLNGNIGTSPVTLTDPPSDPSSSSLLSTNVQDPTIKLCNQFGWKYYDHTNGCSNYNLSSDQPRSAIVNFHRCQDYNSTHQNPLTVCMQLFSGQGVLTNVFFIAQLGPEKEWSPKYFLRIADTSGVSCSLGGGSKREIQPQPPQDRNNDGLTDLVIDIQVDELCENSQEPPRTFQLIFINNGNTFTPTQETLRFLTRSDFHPGFEFDPSLGNGNQESLW